MKKKSVAPPKKQSASIKRVPTVPTAAKGDTCFVISPFGGWFDTYYDAVFEPAITKSGLSACRADDLYRPSSIVHDIWGYVRKAKVLLADLTGKNPNVLYELGLAHALGKPVIMITQALDDVPFDLRNLRVITYDLRDPAWGEDLARRVGIALHEVMDAPELAVPPAFLKERKETEAPKVSPLEKRVLELGQQVDNLRRSQRMTHSDGDVEGPEEARILIRRYMDMGMPDRLIKDRLVRRDVPGDWLDTELVRIRKLIKKARLEPTQVQLPIHPKNDQ